MEKIIEQKNHQNPTQTTQNLLGGAYNPFLAQNTSPLSNPFLNPNQSFSNPFLAGSQPVQAKCEDCATEELTEQPLSLNPIQREEEPRPATPNPPARPQVPEFEAITGTTQAQNSFGDLGDAITRLWHREHLSFIDSAREVASRPATGRMPRATQSLPIEQSRTYQPRHALVMVAWDYTSWKDVPQIRRYLRQGSRFQEALRGEFATVSNHENPTGNNIVSHIQTSIQALSHQVSPGQTGELLVYLTGHGGSGGIYGVDQVGVTPARLRELTQEAARANVHITYIIDSCNIGEIVNLAQQDSLNAMSASVEAAPEARRAQFRERFQALRDIRTDVHAIGDQAHNLYDSRRTLHTTQSQANARIFAGHLSNALSRLADDLLVYGRVANVSTFDLGMRLLEPSVDSYLLSIEPVRQRGRRVAGIGDTITAQKVNELRNRLAPIIDMANDLIRTGIQQLQTDMRSASSSTQAPPPAQ
ncbi:MAG: hypothetical protein MUE85_07340 [Microscillaceae bacterium]|jgi:hypothetical protein|nr:hypothetical protein [Microscillaceae bacterium]